MNHLTSSLTGRKARSVSSLTTLLLLEHEAQCRLDANGSVVRPSPLRQELSEPKANGALALSGSKLNRRLFEYRLARQANPHSISLRC